MIGWKNFAGNISGLVEFFSVCSLDVLLLFFFGGGGGGCNNWLEIAISRFWFSAATGVIAIGR